MQYRWWRRIDNKNPIQVPLKESSVSDPLLERHLYGCCKKIWTARGGEGNMFISSEISFNQGITLEII